MVNDTMKKDDIIIETRDLCKNYISGRQEIHILKGMDLSIATGEFLTVAGASGVGKSTLLHLIGLLDEPTSGKIFFRGVDSATFGRSKKAQMRNNSIGFIFQFFHLLPEFTALENVLLPSLIRKNGLSRKEKKEQARNLLDQIGLGHRLSHRPSQLSGGEQQRVAIARAFMNKPDIILADEPTGNLDRAASDEIFRIIKNLNEQFGQTVVVVTHDAQLAQIGSRRLTMADGRLTEVE